MKKFLYILLILGLSAFWIVSSWIVNDELYFLFQELKYDETARPEIAQYYAVWSAIFLISCLLVKLALKRISPNPKYDFFVWLLIAVFLILFYLTDRGHSWCIIGSIYGIPALGVNYLINGFRARHFSRLKRLNTLVFLAIFLIGGIGEYDSTIWSSTETEKYEIDLSCYTIPTFLDWQCECEIEIKDKISRLSSEANITFGNGPYFKIYRDLVTDEIFLTGDRGGACTFGFLGEKAKEPSYTKERDSSQLIVIATHGADDFE